METEKDIIAGEMEDDDTWVLDSSMDHRRRVPLRASTGAWKASLFIISIEFAERLSYFGIASSLIIYLTRVLHQDLKTAAKNVNYWTGVTTLMPLFGGFLADAYLGRFFTVIASSVVYLLGLIMLIMSSFLPSLKACNTEMCDEPRKIHEVVYFFAIYLISVGTGGHKPSLESFGADQFDDEHPKERKQKMSFFNWWNFSLCSGLLLAVTVIVYAQDHISWGLADVILTAIMATSLAIFVIGRPFYRYRLAMGSPLTPLLQVLVAAIRKRNLPYPSNPDLLYEFPKTEQVGGRFLCHTKKFRCLDKAALVEDSGNEAQKRDPWSLATVTMVEEMKLILNMVPIWIAFLPFGICAAQASTFFIKQSTTLDRKIFNGFEIPPASIFSLTAIGMIISVAIYEKRLVPILRRATGNERGINLLHRVGIGMLFSIVTMVIAAIVERKRLGIAKNNPQTSSLSMSVFWLAPQLVIIGVGDGFGLVGMQEYFYDQVPDSMRSLGIALYLSVIGAANFLSSFLITMVDHVMVKGGKSWFGKDLNSSRLDKFYWLLAAITAANLCVYVVLARQYAYKSVRKMTVANCCEERTAVESMS